MNKIEFNEDKNQSDEEPTKKTYFTEKLSLRIILIGILLLLLTIVLFLWNNFNFSFKLPINSEKFNHFGGFVAGIIGTTWSLAGVILFYVALKEQQKDFKTNQGVLNIQIKSFEQQIKEFEFQRQELELTRNVFIDQSKTLKIQQFESTFFNTFDLLNNITQNINYSKPPGIFDQIKGNSEFKEIYNGKNCFEFLYKDLERRFEKLYGNYLTNNFGKTFVPDNDFNVPFKIHDQLAREAYEKFFGKHQADLGHYFRTLYNIIRLVKNQEPDNSKYYTNLVRAQLSTYEHLLLFYNCFSEYGEEKFKPLIIEYSLLDNMPIDKLLDEKHKEFYPEKAYK